MHSEHQNSRFREIICSMKNSLYFLMVGLDVILSVPLMLLQRSV